MKKQAELRLNLSTRCTRKAAFLGEMELVVPWRELVALIATASSVASTGRPPIARETMQANALVHGEDSDVFSDTGYQSVAKREETQGIKANWHVGMRPGKRRLLDKATPMGRELDELVHVKARLRAKVEHPFRVIKCQFG